MASSNQFEDLSPINTQKRVALSLSLFGAFVSLFKRRRIAEGAPFVSPDQLIAEIDELHCMRKGKRVLIRKKL